MVTDQEASTRLLDHPPSYDESEPTEPCEQFEIDDDVPLSDLEGQSRTNGGRSWLHSMRKFGEERITIPVRYLVDPITNTWNAVSMWFDSKLERWINPLLARRLLVVLCACIIIAVVRIRYSSSFTSSHNLRNHVRLRDILKGKLNLQYLEETTEYFAKMPHYAGSMADDSTSNYVHDFLESLGLPSTYDRHQVFLNHGSETLCELYINNEQTWKSDLQEGQALNNPTASQKQPITQMALALPGDAEGGLVYVNFGTEKDFEHLDVLDKIVLVKFSDEPAGAVAIRAERHKAKGVLFMSAKHPTEPSWPAGRDYPSNAIQQGSLGTSSLYPGDILSPGWSSSMQMTVPLGNTYLAHIPVASISWDDAEPLLKCLHGHGTRMDSHDPQWGNNGAPQGVEEWWTGPNPNAMVHLQTKPIIEPRHEVRNIFAQLEGREMDSRAVIIGARLDSMCYGSTQLSGLNVMLEVARVLADLKYTDNWQPLRSIYFTAWDATSFNYAGVTEWVESVADHLSAEGVIYIDLDLGVSGPDLVVQGNPAIEVVEQMKQVAFKGKSLWDAVDQNASFRPIPGYGNHLAFEAHTGVPTIKLGFQDSQKPTPKDSCFDNMEWMAKFGDPDHSRHLALAELVAYLTLEYSDAPLIPFDFVNLGHEIGRYVDSIENMAKTKFENFEDDIKSALHRSREAGKQVSLAADEYVRIRESWNKYYNENKDPTTGDLADIAPTGRIRVYWDEKVVQANKATLDRNGIAHRNWYKNHLFGPEFDYSGAEFTGAFPAVRDALNRDDKNGFVETLNDASLHIEHMAQYLADVLML